MSSIDSQTWFPVAHSGEVPKRHVYQAQLLGYELAVWRDDFGMINVWENRCPHRGLRLSLGVNTGTELRCQYHGWTYETQSGACTSVPAHPHVSQPSKACALAIATIEHEGFIWATFDPAVAAPDFLIPASEASVRLRSLPINRDSAAVHAALASYRCNTDCNEDGAAVTLQMHSVTPHIVELRKPETNAFRLYFLLQPTSDKKTILHGVVTGAIENADTIRRYHAQLMNKLRTELESESPATDEQRPTPVLAIQLRKLLPSPRPPRREFKCRIVRRQLESKDVISLELASVDPVERLPQLRPGAHIDLTTPSGLVRQYSVVNGPSERDTITIGVKLEPGSRGGSKSMHEAAQVGTVLQASVPRNTFPLSPAGKQPIFIAGGIGITPLISMAQALQAIGAEFELHYFVRDQEHVSFQNRLSDLGSKVHLHVGLNPERTTLTVAEILHQRLQGKFKVYACGPGAMLDAVRGAALEGGFAENDIHFEYFKNDATQAQGEPFSVRLTQSGHEFVVPAGKTLLQALHEKGVKVEASCEQGVCGSCYTKVIEGEIEHHDLYLSSSEKATGKCMMPCVSRARTGVLVLDL